MQQRDRGQTFSVTRVAGCELLQVRCDAPSESSEDGVAGERSEWNARLHLKSKTRDSVVVVGRASSADQAVLRAVEKLCRKQTRLIDCSPIPEATHGNSFPRMVYACQAEDAQRRGIGQGSEDEPLHSLAIAGLRAANHAGLLRSEFRANHQKALQGLARELNQQLDELRQGPDLGAAGRAGALPDAVSQVELISLLSESRLLDYFNRVASAAVLTATNSQKPDSVLSLFDTSAWLFDANGRRRDSYTDTDLWLAWYPGVCNDALTVDEVIGSMPAAPDAAIPWIVKLFENPGSWLRFRGAVDLEDHDILHVLLGRGLQDQDEAFVLGFAMGTHKHISWFQYWVFKFVLARVYPEPYCIPAYLHPAFDLGVACGQATGSRDLYRRSLKDMRSMRLGEARAAAGIDMGIVRSFYEQEQQRIPFTIASLRLP